MDSTALTNTESAQSTELTEPDPLTRHEVFVVRATVMLSVWAVLILCGMLQPRFVERGKVSGGSMAERLLGVHLRVPCRDCEFVFACGTRLNPVVDHKAVCPNCGFANRWDEKNIHDSDEVLIDHADQAIHRWDVVAFNPWEGLRTQMKLDEEDLVVKRVAALPGERFAIRRGDIFINGRRLRKSLAEQMQLRILVHDDSYRPSLDPSLPGRWVPAREGSPWLPSETGYRFEANENLITTDWLTYHHWSCMPTQPRFSRTEDDFVRDSYGYNQDRKGILFYVNDLMLVCRVSLAGSGVFSLSANDGQMSFQVDLSTVDRSTTLWSNGVVIHRKHLGLPLQNQERQLVVSLFDRQLLFAIDGRVIFRHPYDGSSAQTRRPLGIGAENLKADVSQLRVYRDVYYLDRVKLGTSLEFEQKKRLGPNEFFVLGDNVPISEDSRRWGVVSRAAIVGRVTGKVRRASD